MRSGGSASIADISLFVDVESVRSFGQTGYYTGNRDRSAAVGLNERHVTGYRTGSLDYDYGLAFLLHKTQSSLLLLLLL